MRLSPTEFLLSIAAKGGRVCSGETAVLNAIKSGSAALVIISSDASDNTKKKFKDKCTYYEVPVYIYGSKEGIAHAIGKDLRSTVAVTDTGLADQIRKKLEEMSVHGEDQNI